MKIRSIVAILLVWCTLLPLTAFAAEAETDSDLNQLATEYLNNIPEAAFGGMYYNEAGQLVVNVKEDSGISLAVPRSGDVVVNSVKYSLAELEEMKETLEPYMQEYHIVTLDADEVNNTVSIKVNVDDGRIYTLINNLDGLDPAIVEVTILPEDCVIENTVKHCDEIEIGEIPEEFAGMYDSEGAERSVTSTIYPGAKIFFEAASGYSQLTAGPRYNSSKFYSAGHGVYMGKTTVYSATTSTVVTTYKTIGTVTSYTFGTNGDHSLINVSGTASLPSSNSLYGQSGRYTISPGGIVGTSVEMWGSESGITSGKITATNITASVDGTIVKGLSEASYTCKKGDSGAAIFSAGVSTDSAGVCYGIQSAGYDVDSNKVYHISYFSPLA